MIHRSDIQIRDPFILVEGDCYYLFGTTDKDPWKEGHSFLCYKTTDLEHFTKASTPVTMDFHPRHGTVIPITANELARLREAYK